MGQENRTGAHAKNQCAAQTTAPLWTAHGVAPWQGWELGRTPAPLFRTVESAPGCRTASWSKEPPSSPACAAQSASEATRPPSDISALGGRRAHAVQPHATMTLSAEAPVLPSTRQEQLGAGREEEREG